MSGSRHTPSAAELAYEKASAEWAHSTDGTSDTWGIGLRMYEAGRAETAAQRDRLVAVNAELLNELRGLLINTEPLGIQWWDGQNGNDAYRCRACECTGEKAERITHRDDCSRTRVIAAIQHAESLTTNAPAVEGG